MLRQLLPGSASQDEEKPPVPPALAKIDLLGQNYIGTSGAMTGSRAVPLIRLRKAAMN
jgi:hypothetical protein